MCSFIFSEDVKKWEVRFQQLAILWWLLQLQITHETKIVWTADSSAWFTLPLFCIQIFILAHEPKSKASGSMEERNMFPARQHWCKPGTSPTHELPAPSHFALQRWHVYLLFFPFSSLPASLYTPNCAESFDGGWEESECRVEEKRNWALTLIRWSASEKKKKKKKCLLLNTKGSIVKVGTEDGVS